MGWKEWSGVPLFVSYKIGWSRVEWDGMDFISFHRLPLYFFPSNMGGMKNLSWSVLKFQMMEWNLHFSLFHSAPFHSAPFQSALFIL